MTSSEGVLVVVVAVVFSQASPTSAFGDRCDERRYRAVAGRVDERSRLADEHEAQEGVR